MNAQEDQWLNTREAAAFISVKVATLAKWRQKGIGPKYSCALSRDPRYLRKDLIEFMKGYTASNTAEARTVRARKAAARP